MMLHFSAETRLKASVGVFLLSCICLTTSYSTTFVFDHSLYSLVFTCFLSGITLLLLSRFGSSVPRTSLATHKYSAIPLTERIDTSLAEVPPSPSDFPSDSFGVKFGSRAWWIGIAIVSLLGCVRVELYHQATVKIECAPAGYTYTIPFLVSIYDYWRNQHSRSVSQQSDEDTDISSNAHIHKFEAIVRHTYGFLCQSRMRYVISAAFLMIGGFFAIEFQEGIQSTYICPITSGQLLQLRFVRIASVLIDTLILIFVGELFRAGIGPQEGRKRHPLAAWGYALLGVATLWTVIILEKRFRGQNDGFVHAHYLRSAFNQGFLVTLLVIAASQMIPFYGIIGVSILAGFVFGCFSLSSTLFNGQEPFPLIFPSHAFFSLVSIYLGGMLFLCSRLASEEEPSFLYGANLVMRISFSVLFGIGLILVANQPAVANLHSISLLIHLARPQHDTWLSQAKSGNSLADAVANYRKRYNQYPPPGFDKWYDYATGRASVVIDDFDQIHADLLPFRALSPEKIRELTHELATNPFNDIGAIIIRNGTPRVQEGIKPTHAWMVDGAAKMIENFAQHLPDMDLAFNLNDEPRVAIPWEKASVMRNQAKSHRLSSDETPASEWSAERDAQWTAIEPADQTTTTVFTDSAFQRIFDRYVSVLCPPSSKARSQRIWDRRHICLSCVRPHSMGQFPLDWNSMTDICHQPDLGSLHGFFLSPASFKVSQELTPVFSQSKVSGFNDILFPSPWNYMDKIKYNPSEEHPDRTFLEKESTLFWIGSTSEGGSRAGEWKGMPRQRFAHLMNNNTLSHVSVLLPIDRGNETFQYQVMDGTAPSEYLGLNTSVHVADPIVRCGTDCNAQEKELGTAPKVDFQSHWQYRYLFDLDGAGFSGRFLPFLQSHSLPFKTGLFRQWFDSRITPWLHYVPVDIRLHGVWSTLAYFAGVDVPAPGNPDGQRRTVMERHDLRGEWIANQGRQWAQEALRKEDMEIYFFRLLLEWGRLTDDRRDTLGFKL